MSSDATSTWLPEYELNKDDTTEPAKLDRGKPSGFNPTQSTTGNEERSSRRDDFPEGKAHNPKNIHTSHKYHCTDQTYSYMYMHAITISEKQDYKIEV